MVSDTRGRVAAWVHSPASFVLARTHMTHVSFHSVHYSKAHFESLSSRFSEVGASVTSDPSARDASSKFLLLLEPNLFGNKELVDELTRALQVGDSLVHLYSTEMQVHASPHGF